MLNPILRFFKKLPVEHVASIATLVETDPGNINRENAGWPQIERRQIKDRRLQERRQTYCQPYLDSRKNHGRRRSLGRRLGDQVSALPF
jgi:hypothetical protein